MRKRVCVLIKNCTSVHTLQCVTSKPAMVRLLWFRVKKVISTCESENIFRTLCTMKIPENTVSVKNELRIKRPKSDTYQYLSNIFEWYTYTDISLAAVWVGEAERQYKGCIENIGPWGTMYISVQGLIDTYMSLESHMDSFNPQQSIQIFLDNCFFYDKHGLSMISACDWCCLRWYDRRMGRGILYDLNG